jgi:glutaredoxin
MRTSARSVIGLLALVAVAALANAGWGEFRDWRLGSQIAQSARPGDIEMLSSVTCTYCDAARAWFAEHEVPIRECFIERDADCAARFAALQAPGTPLFLVRGERQLGFSASRMAEALR